MCREPCYELLFQVIKIQAPSGGESCVYTIFKVSPELGNDFGGKKFTVHEAGYSEESDVLRSDKRDSTVT